MLSEMVKMLKNFSNVGQDQAQMLLKKAFKQMGETAKIYALGDVAKDPGSFVLHLSGHHGHPDCNGKYFCKGETENGKLMWTHEKSAGVKLVWTGHSWDCFWGGFSPESFADTDVPPHSGYDGDKGNCEIRVKYQHVESG